jgi:hypothetical protein
MIRRFETEFPETRLPSAAPPVPEVPDDAHASHPQSLELSRTPDTEPVIEAIVSDDEDGLRPMLSRHNSDVSLASKALSEEEGRMHRLGQRFRRDILKPEGEGDEHGTTGQGDTPLHLVHLKGMIEGLGGEELKNRIENEGQDALLQNIDNTSSELRKQLIDQDPEAWEIFRDSQEAAERNARIHTHESSSAVE